MGRITVRQEAVVIVTMVMVYLAVETYIDGCKKVKLILR